MWSTQLFPKTTRLPKIYFENECTVNRGQYSTFAFSFASNHFTGVISLIHKYCTIDGLYISISKRSNMKQIKWKDTKAMSEVLTLLIHNSCLLMIFKIRIPFAPFVQLCQSRWCQLEMCRHLCALTIPQISVMNITVNSWRMCSKVAGANDVRRSCLLLYQDWRFVLLISASNLLKNTSAFAESAFTDGMNLAVKSSEWINFKIDSMWTMMSWKIIQWRWLRCSVQSRYV